MPTSLPLSHLKKAVKITDILGIADPPGNEFFIKSPFREEKTPSFRVNQEKNVWFDFGEGVGGSVLDLVMKLRQCGEKEAVAALRRYHASGDPIFSFSPATFEPVAVKEGGEVEVKKVAALNNRALVHYVTNRAIDIEAARRWCVDVYYRVGDSHFFGVGFKNDSGGFEVRNKFYKGCIGQKAPTTIRAGKGDGRVSVFEGFFDFLAALTHYGKIEVDSDIVVLNSLAMLDRVDLAGYDRVNLFLDNDEAGRKAAAMIRERYADCMAVVDYSRIYAGYKDFNDYLIFRRA